MRVFIVLCLFSLFSYGDEFTPLEREQIGKVLSEAWVDVAHNKPVKNEKGEDVLKLTPDQEKKLEERLKAISPKARLRTLQAKADPGRD